MSDLSSVENYISGLRDDVLSEMCVTYLDYEPNPESRLLFCGKPVEAGTIRRALHDRLGREVKAALVERRP